MSATSGYTIGAASSLDLSPATITHAEGNSGTTTYTYVVTRSGSTTGSASVHYDVAGSGAHAADASDFAGAALPSGTVTFAAGDTTKNIVIQVQGDTAVESDEGFTVSLSSASGATLGTASAAGVITNDDGAATHGIDIHGYISGGTVFADANNNGVLDGGEVSTTTDANGNFTLAAGAAPLVSFGGTDISTGLAFTGTLKAPAGSTVVTPLTTLVSDLGGNTAKVLTALGLPGGTNLSTLDPVAAAQGGNPAALLAVAQIYGTASLVGAAQGASIASGFAAIEALINANPGAAIDLTNSATIQTLLPGITDATALAKVSTAIAGTNAGIINAATGVSGAALVNAVSAVERVGEGVESTTLRAAAGNAATLNTAATSYTGANLTAAIVQAKQELAPPAPAPAPVTNHPPVAGADVASLSKGGTLSVAAKDGVLANDTDADGNTLVVSGITGGSLGQPIPGAHGTLSLNADGSYAYHAGSTAGQDVFTYQVGDGHGGTTSATLTISVTGATSGTPVGGAQVSDPNSAGYEVYRLYEAALGHKVDSLTLAQVVDDLNHHRASLSGIASSLQTSPDCQTRFGGLSDDQYVKTLYQDLLGRSADSNGLTAWTQQLGAQVSRSDVLLAFSDSIEFKQVVNTETPQGIWVQDTSASAVARLYYATFNRAPDAAGLTYWSQGLSSGGSLNGIASQFTHAQEFQSLYGTTDNGAFVDLLYHNVLGRDADTLGKQAWLDTLAHQSREALIVAFSDSTEFKLKVEPLLDHGFVLA